MRASSACSSSSRPPTRGGARSVPTPARVEFLPVGGASRAESVRNGLDAIAGRVEDNDRVLVHDAARPCLGAAQLQH